MKNRKMPKKHKHSASYSSWERYECMVKDVKAHNAKVASEKKKKQAIIARNR